MGKIMDIEKINELYNLGKIMSARPFGDGRMNNTYRVVTEDGRTYIVQEISQLLFPDPTAVMTNIQQVCNHLRAKALSRRESTASVLTLIPTKFNSPFVSIDGQNYRVYNCIENSTCYNEGSGRVVREAGRIVGQFQNDLSDFDTKKLYDTLPNFHNTRLRYLDLMSAINNDAMGKASECKDAFEIVNTYRPIMGAISDNVDNGTLPIRVTHNDTKLNNILFDSKGKNAIALVDFDTVGVGSYLYDYGDAIRSVCNPTGEEANADDVYFDMDNFNEFTSGYLQSNKNLTPEEIELMPLSCMIITYELGMRFLTDHLNGNTYFKVKYDGQNYERAMNQFNLLRDMHKNYNNMYNIVQETADEHNTPKLNAHDYIEQIELDKESSL